MFLSLSCYKTISNLLEIMKYVITRIPPHPHPPPDLSRSDFVIFLEQVLHTQVTILIHIFDRVSVAELRSASHLYEGFTMMSMSLVI